VLLLPWLLPRAGRACAPRQGAEMSAVASREGGWGSVLAAWQQYDQRQQGEAAAAAAVEGSDGGGGALLPLPPDSRVRRVCDDLLLGGVLYDPVNVPGASRAALWRLAVGNALGLDEEMFAALSDVDLQSGANYKEKGKRLAMMETDLRRTFPDLGAMFSGEDSPYAQALTSILTACVPPARLPRRACLRLQSWRPRGGRNMT
jgi:hypothetical protein